MSLLSREMRSDDWADDDQEADRAQGDVRRGWVPGRREEIEARLHEIDREKWAVSQADATGPPKEVRLRALNVEAEELRQELKELTGQHGPT